jgi:membrane associated rhomboid family serine protease
MHVVSAEALAEGNGAGDFDAVLTILAGPGDVGVRFLLGGVEDIQIGKLADRHIVLPGNRVSRGHCALVRVDFGPSRWKLVDNRSTNGVLVNGQRVAERELQDGDVISIGEYQLAFARASGAQAPLAAVAFVPPPDGPPCPSCEQALPRNATICVACGIHVKSGRPLLTSHDIDEETLAESARQWLRWVSFLVWFTPMPIPIRSQAFATRKPYAIWTIAAVTALASLIFFVAQSSGPNAGSNLMLWPTGNHPITAASILGPARIHQLARKMTPDERSEFRRELQDPEGRLSDDELVEREMDRVLAEKIPPGHFEWYQLVTHAFLHDTSSLRGFVLHLGGNLLFMLVFGSRVNALIGDLATAILYPILAVAAASVHLLSIGNGPGVPMLGASGAIMGLAGMYLILFPAHKVYCAMWFSIWLWIRRLYFACKIFPMRGFWLLLIYFGYDLLMNAISAGLGHAGGGGGVAHWAHVGGFVTGMLFGLLLLFSRMVNTRGGDVLSITLGKYAWPLIGKPARWHLPAPAALPATTSLGFR